jgi:hypothetical protein
VAGFRTKESNVTQLSRQKFCTHPLHVRLARTSAVLDGLVEHRTGVIYDHHGCSTRSVRDWRFDRVATADSYGRPSFAIDVDMGASHDGGGVLDTERQRCLVASAVPHQCDGHIMTRPMVGSTGWRCRVGA